MNSFIGRLVLAYTVLLSVNAWSAEFTENFDGAVLTSSWQKSADAGYSFQNDGGLGAFSKVDLSPDGTIALTTTFQVLGDFAISVDVDARFGGPLSQGLNLGWIGSTSFAQIFFFRPQLTYQALGTSSASFSWNQRAASPQQVKFEIARVGTKVRIAFLAR